MLTNKDYIDINRTIGTISHVNDTGVRIPIATILAILDFILVGVLAIFFNKDGKPKNLIQLALSLPAIVKFIAEVVKKITANVKATERVKALSNEAKAIKAIEDATKAAQRKELEELTQMGDGFASEAEKRRRIESSREVNRRLKDPNGKRGQ